MKVGLPSFSFCTVLRILFMLVRLACVFTSTGHGHRLTNNPHLDCPSLQPMWGMPEPSQGLGSSSMYRNVLCQSMVVPSWWRNLSFILSLTVIRFTRSYMEVCLQIPLTLGWRGAMGNSVPDVLQSNFITMIFISCTGWYASKYLDQWRDITSNRFVLNMVKGHHLQYRCNPSLLCNFRQLNIKAVPAKLIIALSRRMCLSC